MWTVIAPPQTGWPANNRNVFPIVLKAWDSSIKVSADYVSAEAPLLGWCLPFHCVLTWWKGIHVQALWGHFYKGISPFLRAPPSYPNHLPKGLPPNTITLRLSFEQMNLVSEWVSEWVIEAAQLCPTLCDPMDCSPPGSSVHGILQARILEWVAMPRDLPDPGIEPTSLKPPALAGRFFTTRATWEAHYDFQGSVNSTC